MMKNRICCLFLVSLFLVPFAQAQNRTIYLALSEFSSKIEVYCLGPLIWEDETSVVSPPYPFSQGDIDQINNQTIPNLHQVYSNAGINNVSFTADPIANPSVTVYFQDYDDRCKTRGLAIDGIDTFDSKKSGETVYLFADTSNFYLIGHLAKLIAHETGHTFGLRHIKPPRASDPNFESIMDSRNPDPCTNCTLDRFLDEPFDIDYIIIPSTHNPSYHLRRYVGGEDPLDIENDGVCPGDYDLPLLELPKHYLQFTLQEVLQGASNDRSEQQETVQGVSTTFYDFKLLIDDGSDAMHVVDSRDQVSLSEPFLIEYEMNSKFGFQMVASSTEGGTPDIAISSEPDAGDSLQPFAPVLGEQQLYFVHLLEGGGVEKVTDIGIKGSINDIFASSFEPGEAAQPELALFGEAPQVGSPQCTLIVDIPFADDALRECVLFIADTQVPKWEYANDFVDPVECPNMGTKDLSGVEYLTKTWAITVPGNPLLKNIAPITGMTNLTYLGIRDTGVANLAPVATLHNLVSMDLSSIGTSDMSPLAGLTKMVWLVLEHNQINDISFLANLTNLGSLYINNNNIQNLLPMQNLYNLDFLNADNNEISDTSVLWDKVALTHLYLAGNRITDVTPLLGLSGLIGLNLSSQAWPPGLNCAQQQAIKAALPTTEVSVDGFWDDPNDDPDLGNIGCFLDLPTVYFNNFDGGLRVASGIGAVLDGIVTTEFVRGYAGYGNGGNKFGGDFLRNATGGDAGGGSGRGDPGTPTYLTLTGLPQHSGIDLNFLLAIIGSWDGSTSPDGPEGCPEGCSPDLLEIRIDGQIIFSESFGAWGDPSFHPVPAAVLLVDSANLGFEYGDYDFGYDMYLLNQLSNIPHTADSLVIEWRAWGGGWQGGEDESWAIDNLEVELVTE